MDKRSSSGLTTARRQDEAAREVLRTSLDENIMVLAGAGAGKTHEMITRMVNLVRSGVRVEHLAAITFTKKAAGEMQGRFFDRLQTAADRASGAERDNLRQARRRIDRCYIGTIHSFCGRLLRERALEVGLPPDFTEIDDRDERELRRTAWRRYVRSRDAQEIERLQDLGVTPDDLTDFFGDLCQFEDLELYRPEVERPDLESAVEAVIDLIDEVHPRIPAQPISEKGYDSCQQVILKSRRFLDYHGLQTDGDRAELLQQFEQLASWKEDKEKWTDELTYNRWGERGSDEYAFAQRLGKQLLPELIEHTLAPVLADWEAYVYDRAAAFTLPAVEFYRKLRADEGKLSFQDLLVRARDLLRDRPHVRAFFQQRYRYLFVDEFQDTDPIQAEILFYLTDEQRREEKDWTKLSPRPGSLFLVGDGKQSIYRFRRADYETFNLVRRHLKASEAGRIIHLQRSFRMCENLCGFVNKTFPEIFRQHSRPQQAPFQELLSIEDKKDSHGDDRVRRITVPYKYRNSSRQIAAHDADCIARFIAAMVGGNDSDVRSAYLQPGILPEDIGYGDFMILTRNSTRLSVYAEALERMDVPYDLAGGGTLGDSEELRALLDVLEAIYDPQNPVPLIAYLRGSLVGLSDDELYAYSRAGGRFCFRSSVPEALDDVAAGRFRDAFHALREMEEWLNTLPVSAALERFLDERGVLGFSAVQENGSSRAGTLLKVLALVEEMEQQATSWSEVMDELQEIVRDDSYKIEEMTLEAGARNSRDEPIAVRLMNLHKAKGLEAKVVFLADPYSSRGTGYEPHFHVSRVGEEDPFVVLPVSRQNQFNSGRQLLYRPKGWESYACEEEEFLAAEETRLLYVAATRAENLLVVSRYEDRSDTIKDGYWGPMNPALEEIPELEDCEPAPSPPKDCTVDIDVVERKRNNIRDIVRRPSFELTTVTDDNRPAGVWDVSGQGREYGTLVHTLLELIISNRLRREEVAEYLAQVADEYDVDDRLAEEARRTAERFVESELWEEIRQMRDSGFRVYTEVPFASGADGNVTSGQIDLVFETSGGWKIVDFKTEAASTPKALQLVESHYRSQLAAYKQHWETITDERVVSTALWLTEEGRSVDPDET